MSDALLRAVPGVVGVHLSGVLLGAWLGPGSLGRVIPHCALVMVVAAVLRAVHRWRADKGRTA